MKATLLLHERLALAENAFVEMVVWRVPQAVTASNHNFKYSLALVVDEVCVLRYDNEAGKGDHKHVEGCEMSYTFVDLATLQSDFWNDVEVWETNA